MIIDYFHKRLVQGYRIKSLSRLITSLLQTNKRVLDIGCGDGQIDSIIKKQLPDIHIEGIELLEKDGRNIKITIFDGSHIPFEDNSFDCSLLIDVLHHTVNPIEVLLEAKRVTNGHIIIKDHIKSGKWSEFLLKMMDKAGNERYGVPLPFNYLSKSEWNVLFENTGLTIVSYNKSPGLYWFPLSIVFDGNLHFIAKLKVK